MNTFLNHHCRILALLCCVILLASCASSREFRARSSVVDYLYPNKTKAIKPSVPTLNLPLNVGIAFVPDETSRSHNRSIFNTIRSGQTLPESKKAELLETIAEHFRQQPFVNSIEVIPSAYLTPGGSFANLEQIQTMYGIDVIALVSYDQVQFTDEGLLSFSYWTIVGAYVISGEKNDTQTMMDTAVYDIKSRKMLFRAPGVSQVKGRATPINLSEELRQDSLKGFDEATREMIKNLDQQLELFKQKIKKHPEQAVIKHRPGFSGGGAIHLAEILILAVLVVTLLAFRYRRDKTLSSSDIS